jgi:hypothetical protein
MKSFDCLPGIFLKNDIDMHFRIEQSDASAGRLGSKTQVTNGKTFVVGYSWGDTGAATDKLTSITYPSGSHVNYAYDAYAAVSSISVSPVNANGVTSVPTATILCSTLAQRVSLRGIQLQPQVDAMKAAIANHRLFYADETRVHIQKSVKEKRTG